LSTEHLMDCQPTLTGPTLLLRPLRADDFDALYAVARDPLIWAQHPNHDRWQEPVFRAFVAEALAGQGCLVAIERATGRVIGSSRYHAYDAERSEVEIGWSFLERAHWGGRTNGEMKRLMLDHAFQFVERVIFVIGPDNYRSRHAVEKIGAVLDHVRADPLKGERVVYAITREGWAARQPE
jgi:N-acetyltransferase